MLGTPLPFLRQCDGRLGARLGAQLVTAPVRARLRTDAQRADTTRHQNQVPTTNTPSFVGNAVAISATKRLLYNPNLSDTHTHTYTHTHRLRGCATVRWSCRRSARRAACHRASACTTPDRRPASRHHTSPESVTYNKHTSQAAYTHIYHPMSTVSGGFGDQHGNQIFLPYLPSTSHTNLASFSPFIVRKRVIKIKLDSPRYC